MAIDVTKPGRHEDLVRAIVLARGSREAPRTDLEIAEQCAEAVLQAPFFTELELDLRKVSRDGETNVVRECAARMLARLREAKRA
jgi:hypothetical protein